jgi:hypothetical protein
MFMTVVLALTAIGYNNITLTKDEIFKENIDTAIEQAENWVVQNKDNIVENRNTAMLLMLSMCDQIKPHPDFRDAVGTFLKQPIFGHTVCWKRMLDPNWPVTEQALERTLKKEIIDYKWMVYAIAPDKVNITAKQMNLFDRNRWQKRQLTHQLLALILLRRSTNSDVDLQMLISHLCDRLSREVFSDLAVVDIYIQKIAFILMADQPEKIRKRWIERIIANQRDDGGWNDRWFCFVSDGKGFKLNIEDPHSNQHATVQALMALYFVRYKYPEQFGLK